MTTWDLGRAEEHLLSLELFGMRFGLERMRRLLTALGSPQERFAAVHVVGTNGKSSTVRMTAAILEAAGVRTGSYLSPHLTTFAERVRVGDEDLEPDAFGAAVQRAAAAAAKVDRTLAGGERVTQFELLTAAAFAELARREVEVAVVEAGLGGRWDATNVLVRPAADTTHSGGPGPPLPAPGRRTRTTSMRAPAVHRQRRPVQPPDYARYPRPRALGAPVVVLTNVGLEHTRWLGPTIPDIAREKLAVVRRGATLVLGERQEEVEPLAAETGATIVRPRPVESDLPGYQHHNFEVAATAARALRPVGADAVRVAAAHAQVPGRLQIAGQDPLTIFDGAHNPSGVAALAAALPDGVIAVMSILDDKDAAAMLRTLLPKCQGAVFTASTNPRALPPATLASLAAQLGGPPAETERDPRRALERARQLAGPDGHVVATGSIYLVADLLSPPGARRVSAL